MNTLQRLGFSLVATWFCLLAMTSPGKAVTLSLVDPANTNSAVLTVVAGSTFSVSAIVRGLTSDRPLDSFDIQLAALPSGLTLTSIASPLSSAGWFVTNKLASNSSSGYASDLAYDFYADTTVVNYSISVDALTAPGTLTLDFSTDSMKNALYDPAGLTIDFSKIGASVTVVPEPGSLALVLLGLGGMVLRRRSPAVRN